MTGKSNVQTWSDLHCHILPGIDDGAHTVQITQELLREESKQGVQQVVCTPHFYPEQQSLTTFLDKREQAAQQMRSTEEANLVSIKLGAEVALSLALQGVDLRPLAIENTPYILLEWPLGSYPLWGDMIINTAFQQGLRPIFAHIERYSYFLNDLERLEGYIDKGVLCQMNAESVLSSTFQKHALRLITRGYVHVLASDAHNMQSRLPRLGEAMQTVEEHIGSTISHRLAENADHVFCGQKVKRETTNRQKQSLWQKIWKKDK